MKTCLVTGGAGFIGAHLVEALVDQDLTVHVLDTLPLAGATRLQNVREQIRYFQGSVLDRDLVRSACRDVDVVFHQPDAGSVVETIKDSLVANRTVVEGTWNLLQAARESGVKRFVYGSSASVYGEGGPERRGEEGSLKPISAHGGALLDGESLCQSIMNKYGLETVRLRCFNVYGPRQNAITGRVGVVQAFVDAIRSGRRPVVFGDGMQTRDFVHVEDVVQANLLAAVNPRAAGKAYNVGSGQRTSLIALLGMMGRLMGTMVRPVYTSARPGEIRDSHADITAILCDLGYSPCTDLESDLPKLLGSTMPPLRGPKFLKLRPSLFGSNA